MSPDSRFCEREPLPNEPEGVRVAGSGFCCCCCCCIAGRSRGVEIEETPEGFRPGDFDWGGFGGGSASEAVVLGAAEMALAPAAVRNRERELWSRCRSSSVEEDMAVKRVSDRTSERSQRDMYGVRGEGQSRVS